jgi:competence protein ComEC
MADLVGTRALMTGDIEVDAQKILEELHPDLNCKILKMPHQGAANASDPEFVDSCNPALTLISVERGNRYGHPSARCLGILSDRRIGILRTDLYGDIEVAVGNGKMGVTMGNGVKMSKVVSTGQ